MKNCAEKAMRLPRNAWTLQTKYLSVNTENLDSLLIEQFKGGLDDEDMTDEILREVTTIENIEETTGECVLSSVCKVEA